MAHFTTWEKSHDSPHLTKTIIHRLVPPRLTFTTTFAIPMVRPISVPFRKLMSLLYHKLDQDNAKFGFPHSMPSIDLCLDFPKLCLYVPLLATCLPCLHNYVFYSALPQSLDLHSMPSCSLLPWLCDRVLIWTPNITFANRCVL